MRNQLTSPSPSGRRVPSRAAFSGPFAVRLLAAVLSLLAPVAPLAAQGTPSGGGGGSGGGVTPFTVSTFTLTHNAGGSASVQVNATTTTTFTATNLGASSVTASFVVTACSGALQVNSCSVNPTSKTLAPNASTTVTATFTGGVAAGNGTLTVAAKNGGTTLATASVAVTVTPSGAHTPTVSQANHVGTRLDVGLCVADCFETTFGYATPAYVSRDVPRSVGLLYRSGRAKPTGRVTLDVTDATGTTTAFKLQLADPNGANKTFTNGSTSLYFVKASSGATHVVADFDAATIPTSASLYTAYVTSYDGATPAGTVASPIRIIILNDQTSVYGAGVDLPGVQRLVVQSDGVLVTDGTGSASFFSGSCSSVPCSYGSPAGDFSVLAKTTTGQSRTYPDGTVVSFNGSGLQTSVADRFGNTTSYAWVFNADAGRYVLSSITDPATQTTSFTYRTTASANGWKVGTLGAITTPGGRSSNFGVNATTGNLQQVNDPDGRAFAILGYDTQHRLTSVTDKKSGVWNYVYAYGKTLSYVDAPNVVIATGASVRPRTQVREPYAGLYVAADVDSGTSTTNAIKVPTFDIRAAVTDPLGRSVFYSLNRWGSPRKTYAPLVPADSAEYIDSTGQVTRTLSGTGHDVRYAWNGSQLRTTYDVTLGKLDSLWYIGPFNLLQTIRGTDGQQWFWYDSTKTGWPLTQVRPTGNSADSAVTHYADATGRDTAVTDPIGHRTAFSFATSGFRNQTSVRMPNLQLTQFTYDVYGRPSSTTDPYGVTSRQSLDSLNRTRWSTGTSGNDTTRVYYGALGADSVVKDAKGQTYTVLRNALGWPVQTIDPAGVADSTFYDAAGQVVRAKSRAGREVTFEYDAAGRVTRQSSPARSDAIVYSYDPAGKWIAAQSIVANVIVSTDTTFTDAQAHADTTKSYRPNSQSWRLVHTYNSTDPGLTNTELYSPAAGATRLTYTNYTYDAIKRLSSIWGPNDTTSFHYNSDNLVDSVALRAGLGEKLAYTSSHALSDRSYAGASSVDDALGRWYRSDSLARLVARGDTTAYFQSFGYDSAGRLKRWAKMQKGSGQTCVNHDGYGYSCTGNPDVTLQQVSPTYDAVGNPADTGTTLNAGNRLHQFNGVTMTYDADGFMVKRQTSTATDSLAWDDFGRLVSVIRVNPADTTRFTYDGLGRRIKKTVRTTTVQYLWDGDQMIAETDASGGITQTYTYYLGIDQPRSVTVGTQTYLMSTEADGTVNGLVKKSDRTVAAQYAYTPWGELEANVDSIGGVRVNSLRWKGLLYDEETGLYYMRARYYDPTTRRFISEDPIGLAGGINEYAFAVGDPINGSDAFGDTAQNLPNYPVIGRTDPGPAPQQVGYFCSGGSSLSDCLGVSEHTYAWEARRPNVTVDHQSTGSGVDYRKLATTAGRKLLACSDKIAGLALSAMQSKAFVDGAELTWNLSRSAAKFATKMRATRNVNVAARAFARQIAYSGAARASAASTLMESAGSGMFAFHDTYFTLGTAEGLGKAVLGMLPVIGTGMAFIETVQCLYEK
jgi:RHS repeat-associated protein